MHFHDLRHTWASWLAQSGTPLNVLQELGGWECEAMVKRYAHLAPAQFISYSEKIAKMFNDTNLTQIGFENTEADMSESLDMIGGQGQN